MCANSPIVWTGDLDDDCTARWNGVILRAEWMDKNIWWWAVSIDNQNSHDEIDSSNNYDTVCHRGENARQLAEAAAIKYVTANGLFLIEEKVANEPGCSLCIVTLFFVMFLLFILSHSLL